MNKNQHRIVFNARRGIRMAVAETATSHGKSASGESRGVANAGASSRAGWLSLAGAMGAALLLQTAFIPTNARAQVTADKNAPGNQQATILQTASGITQVNIQTPSAAGVSRNTYSQFDVQKSGVILNNARSDSNTQLGGYVQGNPWLTGNSARVILNEVNSAKPSQLNGYVEVAGQRAEVIIANPAGIAVNGGGFLNASGVTLTTGTPVVNGGNLESYRVRSGSVTIDGAGLDTSTADYTNILTRAATLNAGIWAKNLKIVTGLNQIDATNVANPAVIGSAGAGTDAAPAFALDVAQLGGMYAGKIFLMGTEAGLGVRNSGVIGATAGDVSISNNGWLSNSGTLSAVGNTTVSAQGDVTNTGDLVATGTTSVSSTGVLTNRGLIDSGNASGTGQTRIDAATVNNLGTGRVYGDTISIAATTLNNDAETVNGTTTAATLAARQRLDMGVTTLNNLNGSSILSLGDMAIGGSLDANRQATGSATTLTNSASTIEAQGALTIRSAQINNLNPTIEWTADGGTAGASGTLYFTTQGTFDSAQGALLASGDPLAAMAHGGYAYMHTDYVPSDVCSGGHEYTCTPTGPLYPVYTYTQGQARSNSNSAGVTFAGFASYTQTDYKAVITKSTPGRIASGGDMTLVASQGVVNDQSAIVAGGALTITSPSIDNRARTITLNSVRNGTAYNWSQYDYGCGNVKGCDYNYQAYAPSGYTSTVGSTQVLNISVSKQHSTDALSSQGTTLPVTSGNSLPTSSLYRIQSGPSATVLVQTDPRFTNYKAWLGSDYMTSRISLDPSVTQKRLGDGFYEQQLIREQVAKLTGNRFLGNYTSDQQEYQALMDAGLTYASAYNLRPGIALSAAQVAQLTSDIVWLQQESVTLPDGSITQALVPHVYLALRDGDLVASGALLSGKSVNLATSQLHNSGTIQGRELVQIDADTINNLAGQIKAKDVVLRASQDINNVGGTVMAQDALSVSAGRDLNVVSTTQSTSGSAGNYSFSQSGIDRVAGLYVTNSKGVLLASAGNDMNIIAAQMRSAGDAQLTAGNTVNVNTVQSSQTNNFGAGNADNHLLTSQTREVGSKIAADGNLQITAGQDVYARAAEIQAQGTLQVQAQRNVVLDAGQTSSTFDSAKKSSSSGFFSSSTTSTQTLASAATAQISTLQGKTVSVVADQNLVSVGAQIKGTDSVAVEGKDTSAFYAVNNYFQSTTTTQSSSSFMGMTSSKNESTDQLQKSTAIGTALVSNQKVEIGVGNSTTLRGTTVEAPQIAFVQTDPTKAGNLVLGGSTDTTVTSHTEKNETAGLWQEMKGQGKTEQTLNQTSLKGNVSFDNGLKITAQLPQGDLKAQVQALGAQGGLTYLSALANNPNVKWDQVALAHEQWSYSQQGLTGAGAALVAIAIAVCSGGTAAGLAAEMLGEGMAATALGAGMTSLAAQASVAMINNGGDISKTLNQLGSEQSIKNLLTTMVTAGALAGLDNAMGFDSTQTATGQSGAGTLAPNGVATSQAANQLTQNLLKNVTNNVAGAAIDSAINGKPFDEKALTAALNSGLITAGMAYGANSIGDAKDQGSLNTFTQAVAHAALGCVAGAATAGNSSGCAPGAVGAVVGELAANYALNNGASSSAAAAFAKVLSATAGVLAGGGGDNAAAVNIAATTGANAAENNRILHTTETQKAAQLAKLSKGLFTQSQIEDAMRNSGNSNFVEDINAGSINPGPVVSDKGAVFQTGGDSKSVVQVLPNGGKVDPALAAYILANTGGVNSPYAWTATQTGKTMPSPIDPNASIAMKTDSQWSYVGANSSGVPSGSAANSIPDVTVQVGVGGNASGGLVGGYAESGVAIGLGQSGVTVNPYTVTGIINGPQQGASIGGVVSVSPGRPTVGDTNYSGVTAFGGAGVTGNVTVLADPQGTLSVGRTSTSLSIGESTGAGTIQVKQTILPPILSTIKTGE